MKGRYGLRLDRNEVYVLSVLREAFDFPVGKLNAWFSGRRASVVYLMSGDAVICQLVTPNRDYTGMALASPNEERPRERLGRMIAFARAVNAFLVDNRFTKRTLNSLELEGIARGKYSKRRVNV